VELINKIKMKIKKSTFEYELSKNNIIEADYEYYSEDGDYFHPAHAEIEITMLTLNGDNVTDELESFIPMLEDKIIETL
tara:strand:- start:1720 stop:1956 length:237 start_codon:yes stop_codon:yes gene_type:complete